MFLNTPLTPLKRGILLPFGEAGWGF